mmetsp:Transcript_27060/g.76291  ORF Transcript_27060/g.76291 Transcript_27060/m.76291 type:complete len:354 (-) Transcript_27060:815-1876(-)
MMHARDDCRPVLHEDRHLHVVVPRVPVLPHVLGGLAQGGEGLLVLLLCEADCRNVVPRGAILRLQLAAAGQRLHRLFVLLLLDVAVAEREPAGGVQWVEGEGGLPVACSLHVAPPAVGSIRQRAHGSCAALAALLPGVVVGLFISGAVSKGTQQLGVVWVHLKPLPDELCGLELLVHQGVTGDQAVPQLQLLEDSHGFSQEADRHHELAVLLADGWQGRQWCGVDQPDATRGPGGFEGPLHNLSEPEEGALLGTGPGRLVAGTLQVGSCSHNRVRVFLLKHRLHKGCHPPQLQLPVPRLLLLLVDGRPKKKHLLHRRQRLHPKQGVVHLQLRHVHNVLQVIAVMQSVGHMPGL